MALDCVYVYIPNVNTFLLRIPKIDASTNDSIHDFLYKTMDYPLADTKGR